MKKELIKKKVAFLLALCMVSNFSITVGAKDALSGFGVSSVETLEVSGDSEASSNDGDDNGPDITENPNSATGMLEVSVGMTYFLDNAEFTVTLTDENKNVYPNNEDTNTVSFGAGNSLDKTVSFRNLTTGNYTLTIEGKGFKTFKQTVAVDAKEKCVLKVYAGFINNNGNVDYDEDTVHPGVLMIGDVDGNDEVNRADRLALITALHQLKENADANLEDGNYYDLNGDGSIDIKDLMFFSTGYLEDSGKDTKSSVERDISPDAVKVELSEGVTVVSKEGEADSVEGMLRGEGPVSLEKKGAVTVDDPIQMDLTVTSDKPIDSVVIGVSPETPVEGASIVVVDMDDNKIEIPFGSYQVENSNSSESTEDAEPAEDSDMTGDEITTAEEFFTPGSWAAIEFMSETKATASTTESGGIKVDLGSKIAVKKVTIKITALQQQEGETSLVKIATTQFVNDMASRIPEPDLSIPQILKDETKVGNAEFTISWEPQTNVTGYFIEVKNGNDTVVTRTTTGTTILIKEDKKIKNYVNYTVRVRSTNGSWASDYGDAVKVMPLATSKPDRPDYTSATGNYKSVTVKWKDMDDTEFYNVYYRKRNSGEEYTKIPNIKGTSYTITGLENVVEYEICVSGENRIGEGRMSDPCAAKTTDTLALPNYQMYGLLNRDEETGKISGNHIVNAVMNGNPNGVMLDSPLDQEEKIDEVTGEISLVQTVDENGNKTAWGTLDNDGRSCYNVPNNTRDNYGLVYTFDQAYKMDTFRFVLGYNTTGIGVSYYDKNSEKWVGASYSFKQFVNNNKYYREIRLNTPIETDQIKFTFSDSGDAQGVVIREIAFYYYDELQESIMNLYEDDLHLTVKKDVTLEDVAEFREKLKTPDNGQLNPNKASLERELDAIEQILKLGSAISDVISVHKEITTNDVGRGFSGINAWQPLGVALGEGEDITVYVGVTGKSRGANVSDKLKLVVTQYHSQSNGVVLTTTEDISGNGLKVGANTIKITSTSVNTNAELGGAVYIQYKGSPTEAANYCVRVSGGTKIPVLDLYKVTDETERLNRMKTYIKDLEDHKKKLQELHEAHQNEEMNLEYKQKTCIAGASDILLDTMMLSLPAEQLLAGAKGSSVEEKAENALKSMDSIEQMMYLFYQHKGLSNASGVAQINQIPRGHLNIRYQTMFSGAFMYASGNHIGIEWGSVGGMMQGVPVKSDSNGKYESGNYFGWGIAHEIGHNINQGAYTVAEITNNYFAQLAQAKDTNEGMRFQYENIYQKVTSGATGDCSNIATQLGMYWQLHLAYDTGMNYKTYSNYNDQLANLFYARMDTYARTPSAAPAPGGIALELDGGTDQQLMRLACAAAKKNVLEFFERWGKIPNSKTKAYAEQFDKEERAIFYANDTSRAAHVADGVTSHEGPLAKQNTSAISDVSVKIGSQANKVDLTIVPNDVVNEDEFLAYDIVRCTISSGIIEETPVKHVTTFGKVNVTDTIETMNNRTVFYRVRMIDQHLNRSAVYETSMLKIEHDGSISKANWTIETENLEAKVQETKETPEASIDLLQCEIAEDNPAEKAIDSDIKTEYVAEMTGNTAEIVIDFHQKLTVSGFKYTLNNPEQAIEDYEIYVKPGYGSDWVSLAKGTFEGKETETIYFANSEKAYVGAYSATALKVKIGKEPDPETDLETAQNQERKTISIAEFDVLAPTSDNVDFRRTEGDEANVVIGILEEDYKYAEITAEDIAEDATTSNDKHPYTIPAGSLVFTGSYKGNPAYNVVLLYDEKGNIVGGFDEEKNLLASQIILADVPESGNILDVSDGMWIYWIEPEDLGNEFKLPEKVRVELYRVNDAESNDGQRLVSDSLFETLPSKKKEELPKISFSGGKSSSNSETTKQSTDNKETTPATEATATTTKEEE
ncbi:MAG: M60 family metallopeptidase [Oscillospiraceae bacterium]|nr:M60 family metallopeptidase [Oscillospiraceae bacterium]